MVTHIFTLYETKRPYAVPNRILLYHLPFNSMKRCMSKVVFKINDKGENKIGLGLNSSQYLI